LQESTQFSHQEGEIGIHRAYWKGAIEELLKYDLQVSNEEYHMTPDYIVYNADYEIDSSKAGTMKGRFCQIWRKSNDNYLILREEYSAA
ncbi:unnamed protein product, partial [Strongylus vulgaris]